MHAWVARVHQVPQQIPRPGQPRLQVLKGRRGSPGNRTGTARAFTTLRRRVLVITPGTYEPSTPSALDFIFLADPLLTDFGTERDKPLYIFIVIVRFNSAGRAKRSS